MKKLLIIAAISVLSIQSFAAEIKGARVNMETSSIEIDVAYGGGCKEHKFDLEIGSCMESYPVQCLADLKHDSNGDFCEAYLQQTLSFSIAELGLTDSYYTNGSLTIFGSNNSSATIKIPAIVDQSESKYLEGDSITLQKGDAIPEAPEGFAWVLRAVLESYPEQYLYELVKK